MKFIELQQLFKMLSCKRGNRFLGPAVLSFFFRLMMRGIHMILLYGGSMYFPINATSETIMETNMGMGVNAYMHLS